MSHDIERPSKAQGTTPSVEEVRSAVHPEKKSVFNRLGRGGQVAVAGVALAAVLGGGFGAMKALSGESNNAPDPNPEPGVEAPVVPGEPTAPTEVEPTPAETEAPVEVSAETLRIPANLPAEELARASVELVNTWSFAGATEDTIEATSAEQVRLIQEEGMGYEEALAYMAEENADYYDDALLVDGWENNPNAVEYRQNLVNENINNIVSALARHTNNEPISYWTYDISGVEERDADEGQRLIKFTTTVTPHNSTAEPGTVTNYLNYDITSGSALVIDESSELED